jgi:hypothetical protein
MLKRVVIPGYGPFVFGRKETPIKTAPSFVLPTSSSSRVVSPVLSGVCHDAIQAAAQTLHPIYRAEEDADGNNAVGDCTAAAMMHIGAILQALKGGKGGLWRLPTASDALQLYSKTTNPPFNIQTRANDNGADLGTVLAYVEKFGAYPDGTFKITPPVSVDATNQTQVKAALDKHRILYMGAALADAWIPTGPTVAKVWDVAGPPDEDDGHSTAAYDYNDQGVQINTWGCFVTVTWAALAKYWGAQAGGELYAFDMA